MASDTYGRKSGPAGFAAQFYVFKDGHYLGWDCFTTEEVSAGSGENADLVLDDQNISEIQALFCFRGNSVTVSDVTKEGRVFVNSKSVETRELKPLDVVSIGTYTIKVKVKWHKTESRITNPSAPSDDEYKKISALMESVPDKQSEGEDEGIKTEAGKRRKKNSEDNGVKQDIPEDKNVLFEKSVEENEVEASEDYSRLIDNLNNMNFDDGEDDEDDDEEDDEDDEALFLLRDKLEEDLLNADYKGEKVIKVVKLRENSVIDVCFLTKKGRYCSSHDVDTFCIAENADSSNTCNYFYFYFSNRFRGKIRINNDCKDTDLSYVDENRYKKSGEIYQGFIPINGTVVISDGIFDYLLQVVEIGQSPPLPPLLVMKSDYLKIFSQSAIIHLIGIFLLWQITLMQKPLPRNIPEDDFVRIDMSKIKLPKKEKKKKKKIKINVQKPAPKEPAAKKSLPKIKSEPAPSPPLTPEITGTPETTGTKGNVENININQAGILSALSLGESIDLEVGEALAAVTNLDAVPSSQTVDGGFKVGGIVGKLTSSGISAPSGGVLATKGVNQVLRSSNGENRVAALAAGRTGKDNVKASVSIRLNKNVRVKGGMSRKEIKKVIDIHLDEITYCYETELISNHSLMGKVIFEWKILLSGKVGEVGIKFSSINTGRLNFCIMQAIRSWQFPRPKGAEVVVSYPFIFDVVGF